MEYCQRCCYPKNSKPYILINDGLCSGCRVAEQASVVDWAERLEQLKEIARVYKAKAKANNSFWDCIIPVSGGKDSHFQVHFVKNVLKMNPLLVTYNHLFNTPLGNRNLRNLLEKLSCDHVRFSSNIESVRKITRLMLHECGDLTWHYHAGILTYPLQAAVLHKIPLVIWAENNFSNLVGTFDLDDMVEFSKKSRKDFGLRGIEAMDYVEKGLLDYQDVAPFVYPSDDDIESVGVKGIYLSNYIPWDEKGQAEDMIRLYDFGVAKSPRDRTFNLYAKLEDYHANGTHDYLKYLKFGYGRATDDASTMIRQGYISREEGISYVEKYDHIRPRDLDLWLDFVDMSEEEFLEIVESQRDPEIWQKDVFGKWQTKDSIVNHINDPLVDDLRLDLVNKSNSSYLEGKYHVEDPRWMIDYKSYPIL